MSVSESDLIVEDGTGITDANTYVSLAVATEYHRLRDNTAWEDAGENNQVASLIRASQYLDDRWQFQGTSFVETQGLEFPKTEIYDKDGYDVGETVPIEIINATCEYALQAVGDGLTTTPLFVTPDQTDPRAITMQRDVVGPLETETRYDANQGIVVTKSYPAADRIIKNSGYLSNGGVGGAIR